MNKLQIRKAGKNLETLDDWFQTCPPPPAADGWEAGRPAWENARSFFSGSGEPGVPEDLRNLLQSSSVTGAVRLDSLVPEFLLQPDDLPGTAVRLHALGTGISREGRVAIALQARTDGGFGPLISAQAGRSRPGSQWSLRMENLAAGLMGRDLAECGELRADLFPLAAAALRSAETVKASTAFLVFREFRPHPGRAGQIREQAADLDRFSAALGGGPLKPGVLTGPLRIPGGAGIPGTVPLFLGKTLTLLKP